MGKKTRIKHLKKGTAKKLVFRWNCAFGGNICPGRNGTIRNTE